jgi:hypothetical protein
VFMGTKHHPPQAMSRDGKLEQFPR